MTLLNVSVHFYIITKNFENKIDLTEMSVLNEFLTILRTSCSTPGVLLLKYRLRNYSVRT